MKIFKRTYGTVSINVVSCFLNYLFIYIWLKWDEMILKL